MKTKIIGDSCLINHMLPFGIAYIEGGQKEFDKTLGSFRTYTEGLEDTMQGIMLPDFQKKYETLPFYEMIDEYKGYIKNQASTLQLKIGKLEKLLKAPQEIRKKATKADAEIRKEIRELTEKRISLLSSLDRFTPLYQRYKKVEPIYSAGKLFEQVLWGKYDLHVTSTIYDELTAMPDTNSPEYKIAQRRVERVSTFAKHFLTLIKTKGYYTRRYIDFVSPQLRERNNNTGLKSMPKEEGRIPYADTIIMTEANLAGIPIVTQNEQHYITNTGICTKNDEIRQHIANVGKTNRPISSDVVPSSVHEVLDDKLLEPMEQSKVMILRSVKEANQSQDFKNEVELDYFAS